MRKLRKNTNQKLIAIAVILLLAISIGYAALSTTLSINGTANIASSSWSVYFTNVEVRTGSVTATTVPTTTGTSTTTLTWAVSMDTPGQFYEYTVDVKNDGSIDAMIGTLSNTSLTTNQAKYLDYTVTYSDGAVIEQYDKLDSGETVKLKVRLKYKTDLNPEDLPGEGANIALTYTSNYVQADSNAKERDTGLDVGDSVNYSTSLNGVTLNNWKVFYIDGDYTTLIYGDYLPNTTIDTTNVFTDLITYSTYGVCGNTSTNRSILLNEIQTKSNWDDLLSGTINGEPVNETRTANVWAMGSPTIELWRNSWNTKYPEDSIYIAQTETVMNDGIKGYCVGLEPNPTTYSINLSSKTGYNNTLYYPQKPVIDECNGYWIISPSASDYCNVMAVYCGGNVFDGNCARNTLALRPVVCLPTSIIAQ